MDEKKQIEEIDELTMVLWEANHKKSVLDYRWLATEAYNACYRKVILCKNCDYCDHCYTSKEIGEEAKEAWYCNVRHRRVSPEDYCCSAKMGGGAE